MHTPRRQLISNNEARKILGKTPEYVDDDQMREIISSITAMAHELLSTVKVPKK